MRRWLRGALVWGGGGLLTLAGAAGLLLWSFLPVTSGELGMAGLSAPVEILRDRYGVPHLYAERLADLAFAQGFVAAQDRLWQMDLFRRAAAGRLAEVLGAELLPTDRLFRTLGFERAARQMLPTLSEESRAVLEAYARGVNAAIETIQRPHEFWLLGYRPEPWAPSHSLAIGRLMAWELSQWRADLVLGKIAATVDAARAQAALPSYPPGAPLIVPPRPPRERAQAWEAPIPLPGFGRGASNSWVVGGSRSVTGKPLLANDPHLTLTLPSRWYEIHLSGEDMDVYGFSIPGTPGVVIGFNRAIAWGFSNLMLDDADFFREIVNPNNPRLYRHRGQWEAIRVHREEIRVKGREPVEIEVRQTHHGPLVHELLGLSEPTSLRWIGQDPSDEVWAVLEMNRATNWPAFREALRAFQAPGLNVVYADRYGTIAYQAVGRVPVRAQGDGRLPVPGWSGEFEWIRWAPFDTLPRVVNPPEGIIVTANQRITEGDEPFLSTLWEPPDRAMRIRERLDAFRKLSLEDLLQIQLDRAPPSAQRHVARVIPHLETAAKGDPLRESALALLRGWTGEMSEASSAAALYAVLYERLLVNTFRDELDEGLLREFLRTWNLAEILLDRFIEAGESPWFDDVQTAEPEGLPEVAARSFGEAVTFLEARFGKDPARWRWGALHTTTFEHPLGKRRPLQRVYDRGPFPMGGDVKSVWVAAYRHDDRFQSTLGPSFRLVVALGDRPRARAISPGGQSGLPWSRHYADQLPGWLRGESHPCLIDRQEIEAQTTGRLRLRPQSLLQKT
ncbi:MAG: penicillin acylase family protein [Candidatus Rokubacteria bacterium]|nr:penicillin acylase family protein [Candidatus Rokubacteria bacterium]